MTLKSRVREIVQRLKNVRLRFSFWAHMMLDTPNDPSKVMTLAAVVNIAGNAS